MLIGLPGFDATSNFHCASTRKKQQVGLGQKQVGLRGNRVEVITVTIGMHASSIELCCFSCHAHCLAKH